MRDVSVTFRKPQGTMIPVLKEHLGRQTADPSIWGSPGCLSIYQASSPSVFSYGPPKKKKKAPHLDATLRTEVISTVGCVN